MYYGNLKTCDIANGPGVRVTLFVSGCTNRCEFCFQPQTWDFHYGQEFTEETAQIIYGELEKPFVRGLTLLGGEPFEPENQRCLVKLLRTVKERYPDKDIWSYTGFTLERLLDPDDPKHTEVTEEMLSYLNVLVDGRFVNALKDIRLRFCGSSNQRLIDMPATLKSGTVTLWDDRTGKVDHL